MFDPITAAVIGTGALTGGLNYLGQRDQTRAYQNAAGATNETTRYGMDLQNQQWLQNRQDMMPWMQTGQAALGSLADLMGLQVPSQQGGGGGGGFFGGLNMGGGMSPAQPSAPGGSDGYTLSLDPNATGGFRVIPNQTAQPAASDAQAYRARHGGMQRFADIAAPASAPARSPNFGSLMKGFDLASASPAERAMYDQYAAMAGTEAGAVAGKRAAADQFAAAYNQPGATGVNSFQADPGYAFRRDEGQRAVEASRAAQGGYFSGQTGVELQNFGQGLASQEYQNAYNRWASEKGMADNSLGNEFNRWLAADAGMSGEYNNMFNRYNQTQGNQFNRLADLAGLGQSATGQIGNQGMNMASGVAQMGQQGAINAGNFGGMAAQAQAGGYGAIGNALNQGMDTYLNYNLMKNLYGGGMPNSGGSGYGVGGQGAYFG